MTLAQNTFKVDLGSRLKQTLAAYGLQSNQELVAVYSRKTSNGEYSRAFSREDDFAQFYSQVKDPDKGLKVKHTFICPKK